MNLVTPRTTIRRPVLILLIVLPAAVAQANPRIDPTSVAATFVVVLAAFFLEILITSGVLLFAGMAAVPTFAALVLGNVGSYFGVLGPLAFHFELHIVLVELAVVAAETAFIKLISLLALFQQDRFIGLKWRYAFLAALLGNASSYYIGTLMT